MNKNDADIETVALRFNNFPILSQTFIVNHINLLLEEDYNVLLHVDSVEIIENNSIQDFLNASYGDDKLYVCLRSDTSFCDRLIAVIKHTIRFKSVFALIKSLNPIKFGRSGVSLRVYRSFSSLLESPEPSLAHAHFGHNGVALIRAKLCGAISSPIITTFHGYDAYLGANHEKHFREKYSLLFELGDYFIVNSKYLQGILIKLGCPECKIKIIPNFIDTDLFKPRLNSELPTREKCKLITVGRLIPLKNQRLGIQATACLKAMGVDADYTIVGGGPELKNLQQFAYDCDVSDSVRFMGEMSSLEISKELRKHHIFLMTTLADSEGRAETQGIVTLEAQSTGLPAIVSGVGGTPETIEHGSTGYVLGNLSPEKLAGLIVNLLEPDVYHKFSIAARDNVVKKFSKEVVKDKIFELYRLAKN